MPLEARPPTLFTMLPRNASSRTRRWQGRAGTPCHTHIYTQRPMRIARCNPLSRLPALRRERGEEEGRGGEKRVPSIGATTVEDVRLSSSPTCRRAPGSGPDDTRGWARILGTRRCPEYTYT